MLGSFSSSLFFLPACTQLSRDEPEYASVWVLSGRVWAIKELHLVHVIVMNANFIFIDAFADQRRYNGCKILSNRLQYTPMRPTHLHPFTHASGTTFDPPAHQLQPFKLSHVATKIETCATSNPKVYTNFSILPASGSASISHRNRSLICHRPSLPDIYNLYQTSA